MPLPKTLVALDRHLADKNRRELSTSPASRRRPKGQAPIAPVPQDPMVCRWCRGRLKVLLDGKPFCEAGCADTHIAPYLGDCRECERPFETGRRRATLCHECDVREQAQADAEERSTPDWVRDRSRGRFERLEDL